MRVEIRKFKHAEIIILFPDGIEEEVLLDRISKYPLGVTHPIDAELSSDDAFNPYIRIHCEQP